MKKTIPNRAANMRKPAAAPEANALTGSAGSAARRSRARAGPGHPNGGCAGDDALAGGAVAEPRSPPTESGWVQKFTLLARAGWPTLACRP